MLVYSVMLILVMMFRPTGLFGSYEFSLYQLLTKRRKKAVEPEQTAAKGDN